MFKNRKLSRSRTVIVAGLALLVVSALFLVPAVLAATPSCFTDVFVGDWHEAYVCWMKNKGYSTGYQDGTFRPNNAITRAEVSAFMQRMLSTGDVYINTGPTAWVVNANTPSASIEHYAGFSWLSGPAISSYRFSLSPSLPASIYNTKMYVKGVKYCYDASIGGAYITTFEIKHFSYSAAGYSYKNSATESTDIEVAGCRSLYFMTPASLNGNDQITIEILMTTIVPAGLVKVGVTTVILTPSAEVATLSEDMLPGMDVTLPQVNDGTGDG